MLLFVGLGLLAAEFLAVRSGGTIGLVAGLLIAPWVPTKGGGCAVRPSRELDPEA